MRIILSLAIMCLLSIATYKALGIEPAIEAADRSNAHELRAKCRPAPLRPGVNFGTVSTEDCIFNNGSFDQYEDIFIVSQGRLRSSGVNQMATFALEDGGFNWIFGLGAMSGDIFPNPVYAFRRGPAGVHDINGFLINTFSVIGGDPVYKMWVGGQDTAQVGDYTLTVGAELVSNTCAKGHRVYLQGDVSFSSAIANENSCSGIIQFGPNEGQPFNFQYWWIRLSAGETITMELTGLEDSTVAAAIIDFVLGEISLDLGDGPGDADRFVTFTASSRRDIYVEVSSAPDAVSPYTVNFDGP